MKRAEMRRVAIAGWLVGVSACAATPPAGSTAPTPPVTHDATAPSEPTTSAPTIVVFVRHAEKLDDSTDTPLSPAGEARARCLAEVIDPGRVTHVLATELRRTEQTVRPIADRDGLEVEVIAASDQAAWVQRLRALPPGAVALVAGHSNTVPALVHALTGRDVAIASDEYDRMFVIALADAGEPRGRGSMVTMRACGPAVAGS